MKKRLVSLLCALSMIFTVLGSFSMISVNAAEDAKVTGVAELKGDEAAITVSYSGLDVIKAFQVKIPVDTEIFEEPATNRYGSVESFVRSDAFTGKGATSWKDNKVTYVWNAGSPEEYVEKESADIFTLTLKLKEGVTVPEDGIEIELTEVVVTNLEPDNSSLSYGTEDQAPDRVIAVTNPSIAGPTAGPTAEPTEEPTPTPEAPATTRKPAVTAEPTEEPATDVTDAPTAEPTATPLPDTNVKADAVLNGDEAAITVSYSGLDVIKAFQVKIPVDTEIFEEPATNRYGSVESFVRSDAFTGKGATSWKDNKVTYVWNAGSPEEYVEKESADIFTLTLKLKEGVTVPEDGIEIELTEVVVTNLEPDNSSLSYGTEDQAPDRVIAVGNAVVKAPVATPEPTEKPEETAAPTATPEVKEVELAEVVDVNDEVKAAAEAGDVLYIDVTFKGAGDTKLELEYGKDFVAEYNGEELTENEYNNLLNGYTADGTADVEDITATIKGLKYKFYAGTAADGLTAIAAVVNDETQNIIVSENEADVTDDEPSDGDKTAKWSWDKSTYSVGVGNTITVKATLKLDGVTVPAKDIEYEIESTKTAKISSTSSSGAKVKGVKSGTTYIVASYGDYKSTKKKITVTTSGGSSSSSGSSSNSGSINSGITYNNNVSGTIPNFTDIWSVPWAEEAINGLAAVGVINGKTDTLFDPEASVTRAEFTKILVGAFGLSAYPGVSSFADVPTTHWAYQYISIASSFGIVNGYSDTEFGPDRTISRQEMAAMVYRAATQFNKDITAIKSAPSFTDADAILDYAKPAVNALYSAGIINGMDDGSFSPLANATRAQAAVILYKFVNR